MTKILLIIIALLIAFSPLYAYQSLQEVFDSAQPAEGYDRYVVLDNTIEYEGDLIVTYGQRAYINGNGALIHGISNMISIIVLLGVTASSSMPVVPYGMPPLSSP